MTETHCSRADLTVLEKAEKGQKTAKSYAVKALKDDEKSMEISKSAPKHLDPVARYLWTKMTKVCPHLRKMDEPNLELFCANYAVYREALRSVQEKGVVYESNGSWKKNPATAVMDASSKTIRSLSTALGLDFTLREEPEEEEEYMDALGVIMRD